MEDRMNDFEGLHVHQFSVELKEGEALYQLIIEFPETGENLLIVREREMRHITTILNYNRYVYTVEPLM